MTELPAYLQDPSTFIGLTGYQWLYLGSALLFSFGLVNLFVGKRRTEDEEDHLFVHVIVCFIAGTAYYAMASGIGAVELDTGRNLDFARYMDWSVTTPLLLYGLGLTAMHGSISRKGVLIAIIGFDILMILTGLIGGFVAYERETVKFFWFALGCVFFVAVLALLWTDLREESKRRGPVVAKHYTRNLSILSVLWSLYAVVWFFGHAGFGYWSVAVTAGLIVILDTTSKGVYGIVSILGTQKIVEAEARGEVRDAQSGPRSRMPQSPDPRPRPLPAE